MNPEELYLTFAGQLDNPASGRFFNTLNLAINNGVKRVHLIIQSTGGFVGDGVAVHKYLKGLPVELITYNLGQVSSIAVTVFLSGKVRKASAHATFLVHKTFHNAQRAGAEELRSRAESAQLDDSNTEAILREYLNMPEEKWALHSRGDLHFGAEEAKEYGLIHEVSEFSLPVGFQIFNV